MLYREVSRWDSGLILRSECTPRWRLISIATRMAPLIAPRLQKAVRLLTLLLALCSTGCASVSLRHPVDGDPFEHVNRSVFAFNTNLDHALLRPIARSSTMLPAPLSSALRNFVSNLLYPITAVNDFLQGNLHDGTNDVARLLLNTMVGVGGLLDPATTAGLDRNCQDFGITLGKWGIPGGPYLTLPLLGPSTVRDAAATMPELFAYVLVPGPAIGLGILGGNAIEDRARLLPADMLVENAYDPYAFQRNVYLQHRDFQVRGSSEELTEANDPPSGADERITFRQSSRCGCLLRAEQSCSRRRTNPPWGVPALRASARTVPSSP